MNRLLKLSFLSLLAVVIMSSAEKTSNAGFFENNKMHNIYAGLGIGTTGGYVEAAYYFKNFIGIRAEVSGIPQQMLKGVTGTLNTILENAVLDGVDLQNVNVDTKIHMLSWGFDASIRPLGGSWRIDIGVRSTKIGIEANGKGSTGKVGRPSIGYYSADMDVNTELIISKGWKPYFGTGWDWNPVAGFTISLSLGAIYTISPWDLQGSATVTTNLTDPAQQADVKKYTNDFGDLDLKSLGAGDVQKYLKFYPIVKFGIGYKFNFG